MLTRISSVVEELISRPAYLDSFQRSSNFLCICSYLWDTRQTSSAYSIKHNYIHVIYKVLVYVQTSQPTTCFGLFQLGHLQVGHKGQRNYTICTIIIKVRGGRDLVYKFGACVQTGGVEIYALMSVVCGNGKICYYRLLTSMHIFQHRQSAHMPQICKRDLVPPDFNDNGA